MWLPPWSSEGDAALLDDPAVHFQSAQLLCQDLLELLGQDGVRSGREKPNSVGWAVPARFRHQLLLPPLLRLVVSGPVQRWTSTLGPGHLALVPDDGGLDDL